MNTKKYIRRTERETKKMEILSLVEADRRKVADIRSKLSRKKKRLDDLKGLYRGETPSHEKIEYR